MFSARFLSKEKTLKAASIKALSVVRVTGIEPALPFENMNLNHTRLPVPPYPHIKFSSSKFYTVRTFRGGAFRLIRKYKNAFLRFYRIYTEMALPESSASAYSAISANIKFIGQPRPRDSCGRRNFLRLGAPKKFRPMRLCLARCICHRQHSQANCLFRHTRILSFRPLNFTR